ncbi:MAG: DUF2946 domain-containing protein [Burkholderiales bacterium]
MTPIRQRLRLFTWVALFAMLGLAIAPSVSHALSAQQSSNPWTEICSTSNPADPPRSAAMLLEHCAMCGVVVHAMGMPPAPVTVLPAPEGAACAAALFLEASHPLFAWRPPPARAPPSFS